MIGAPGRVSRDGYSPPPVSLQKVWLSELGDDRQACSSLGAAYHVRSAGAAPALVVKEPKTPAVSTATAVIWMALCLIECSIAISCKGQGFRRSGREGAE